MRAGPNHHLLSNRSSCGLIWQTCAYRGVTRQKEEAHFPWISLPFPYASVSMDLLANHSIFQELQLVHDTGYFSAMPSLEENWQQVSVQTARGWYWAPVHPGKKKTPTFELNSIGYIKKGGFLFFSFFFCLYHSYSLLYVTLFPELDGMRTTLARNKAVKCDLERWRCAGHHRDRIGRELYIRITELWSPHTKRCANSLTPHFPQQPLTRLLSLSIIDSPTCLSLHLLGIMLT